MILNKIITEITEPVFEILEFLLPIIEIRVFLFLAPGKV